jgi:hypothetical protein
VPNVTTSSEGGDRAKQVAGTATNPGDPDTDHDGILDGVEDSNRNGWVDGDGAALPTTFLPFSGRSWPDGEMDPGETWIETDPNNGDTDDDGLSDGFGEDKNFDGAIAGDADNDNAYDGGELWTETNPLKKDTDGDGLPDGWETQYGLDPLDNGTLSYRTGGAGNPNNGGSEDPDDDGFSNLVELANGTDPNVAETGGTPPAGSIVIGPQAPITSGAVVNAQEFTDWTVNDLIVLDEYDGAGTNNQGSDLYHAYDGFDSSRDLVAFYAHDGGDVANGGDGNFYFRVDLHDLKALAEVGNLDIYVAIDTGNTASGEFSLPDDIDTGTNMKWEAVVACYSTNNGVVYVDTANGNNSTAIGQNLTTFGVQPRAQTSPVGFKKAHFNSDLDAVEFSISRQALRDAGWNGLNAADLNFQVFTTRDGTTNTPPGAGDIGGRSDIRDTFYDDFIASDYYKDQSSIAGDKSVLKAWFSARTGEVAGQGSNDRGKRAKVISLVHGNQAIQPGTVVHNLINNTLSAGYYRVLDAHSAFSAPLAMHITPTLASAIQWAKVDPPSSRQYRDGPSLNSRVGQMIDDGVIDLLGSTFSDHALPYFHTAFNQDNRALSETFLETIYGASGSEVFWTPERISDAGVLQKVGELGYGYTFIDQMRHVTKWFGRTSALGDDGYRLNLIHGIKCFVINDQASTYRFQNTDNGLANPLRQLLNRKARSGTQDQVVTVMSAWEDFTTKAQADAYDKNVRWLASRPWIRLVTPDQIAAGEVDLSQPADGTGDAWGSKDRSTDPLIGNVTTKKVAHDYIDHATQENYDNWYFGSAIEESLRDKVFNIRTGAAMPSIYGLLGTNGIVNDAWQAIAPIIPSPANIGLLSLARGTLHASSFETAFHTQTNNDLSKYSTGEYVNPDTSSQTLAGFAKIAQAQTRNAAVYARVNAWATAVGQGTYTGSAQATQQDIDLDGELEYLIHNDRIFALFERIGGRMTGAWVRDVNTGYLSQVVGNFVGYAGSETEEEGAGNFTGTAVNAHRTSGFKDWFAKTDASGAGTFGYVNDYYNVVAAPAGTGWKFTSGDGKISKTITLAPSANRLQAGYTTTGMVQLFIRFGLSPDLLNLLLAGQTNLNVISNAQEFNLFNNNSARSVRAYLRLGGGSFAGAAYNAGASDLAAGILPDTLPMRNQAQTQQVEIEGNTNMTFALGFETGTAVTYDADGDGLPDWWESQYGFNPNDPNGTNGANADNDGDGRTSLQEFIVGTDPNKADSGQSGLNITRTGPATVKLTFSTIPNRIYRILYSNVVNGTWLQAGGDIVGTGSGAEYTDNGLHTGSPPSGGPRFYKLEVALP